MPLRGSPVHAVVPSIRVIMARSPSIRMFPPVRPSAGYRAEYNKRLATLIEKMHRSISYWVAAAYRDSGAVMAQDLDAATEVQRVFERLAKKWQKRFDGLAPEMAEYMAKRVRGRTDKELARILRKGGISVRFKMTPIMKQSFEAVIHEQVGLIKTIPERYLSDVQGMVMRSVATGRDLGTLTAQLQNKYGLTQKRAAFIARDQNNKATAVLVRARQLDVIGKRAEAIWCHSNAGRHPRPGHVAAGAKKLRYFICEGAFIDGEWIQPGELPNCRCTAKLVFPGLDS